MTSMHPWQARTVKLPFPAKLGILSDTHASHLSAEHLEWLREIFSGVMRVIHLGDVVCPAVLSDLEALGFSVLAVKGNNDRLLNTPTVLILESGDRRIGATHGGGGAYQEVTRRALRQIRALDSDPLHAVLYGHTHVPALETGEEGILFFNPGSLGHPRQFWRDDGHPPVSSVGTLEISESGFQFRHHFFPNSEKNEYHLLSCV